MSPDTNRDFTPAEIVRIHEANCQIDFPMSEEQNFRLACMKYIARRLNLAELRQSTMTGPGEGIQRPRGGQKS